MTDIQYNNFKIMQRIYERLITEFVKEEELYHISTESVARDFAELIGKKAYILSEILASYSPNFIEE